MNGWSGLAVSTRIMAIVACVVAGAAIGALATVSHQATTAVGGVVVPWGVIVGLAIVALVLVGSRLAVRTRAVAASVAGGIVGMVAVLSLESAGGSVLIPQGTLALVWIYGCVLIASVTLAWPRLGRGARDRIASQQSPKGTTVS